MNTETVTGLARVKELRESLKKETRDYRESLPAMPADVFARLLARIVSVRVEELAEGDVLRSWQDTWRLLSSQKEQLEAARQDHAIRINEPERKGEIVAAMGAATFSTFKVKITKLGVHKFSLTGTLKV